MVIFITKNVTFVMMDHKEKRRLYNLYDNMDIHTIYTIDIITIILEAHSKI